MTNAQKMVATSSVCVKRLKQLWEKHEGRFGADGGVIQTAFAGGATTGRRIWTSGASSPTASAIMLTPLIICG